MKNFMSNINIGLMFTGISTAIGTWVGGYDTALYILCAVIVLDFVSGIMKAIVKKELSSWVGVEGVLLKLSFLIMVIVGNLVDMLLHTEIWRNLVCYALIFNEFLSICENLAVLGVPIPKALIKMLSQVKDALDEGEMPNE